MNSYSLTQLCNFLDCSPAWVHKVQDIFDIRTWGSGIKGAKSYYVKEQVDFFIMIKVLRGIGFGFYWIKKMLSGYEQIKINDDYKERVRGAMKTFSENMKILEAIL